MTDTTFDIVIRYSGDSRYQPLFDDAAERWEQIIIADIPDVNSSQFGFVDDLLIDASVVSIDGRGGVLGQAGPDWIRSSSGLPFHGEMEFDSADVSSMFNNGTLYDVILHEMGHVLGVGTLWDWHDLINGFQYIGANALAQYRIISGNSSATFVPVENSGGPGTAGGHWEEDIFNAELMTGFIESAGVAMPISRITVGSLADLGYVVNMAAANPFSLPGGPPPSQQPAPGGPTSSTGAVNNDFDGDRDSDIVWRHTDGSVQTWEMENGGFVASHDLPLVSTAWQLDGTGDFDADGDTDILWRHTGSMVVTWEMENGAYVTNHNIAHAGADWTIEGYGDFDGDRDADIMWRNNGSGAVVTWEMEDGNIVTNHNIAFASASWQIDGFGDFDGDGDSDVIWRHQGGAVVTWEMEDNNFVTNHNIEVASTSWQIDGTGDFDNDGDSDILWRHDEGMVVTWEMEDGEFVGNHSVDTLATTWQVQATGDFDADGDSDILWRSTAGAVVTWDIEDHAHTSSQNVGTMASAWTLIG